MPRKTPSRQDEVVAELRRQRLADRVGRYGELVANTHAELGAAGQRNTPQDHARREHELIHPGALTADPPYAVNLELGPKHAPDVILERNIVAQRIAGVLRVVCRYAEAERGLNVEIAEAETSRDRRRDRISVRGRRASMPVGALPCRKAVTI